MSRPSSIAKLPMPFLFKLQEITDAWKDAPANLPRKQVVELGPDIRHTLDLGTIGGVLDFCLLTEATHASPFNDLASFDLSEKDIIAKHPIKHSNGVKRHVRSKVRKLQQAALAERSKRSPEANSVRATINFSRAAIYALHKHLEAVPVPPLTDDTKPLTTEKSS